MSFYFPFDLAVNIRPPSVSGVLSGLNAGFHAIFAREPDPTVYRNVSLWMAANIALFYWTITILAPETTPPPSMPSRLFWGGYFAIAVTVAWQHGMWTGAKMVGALFFRGSYLCRAAAAAGEARSWPCVLGDGVVAGLLVLVFLMLFMVWVASLFAMGIQMGVSLSGGDGRLQSEAQERLVAAQDKLAEAERQRRQWEEQERRRAVQRVEDAAADERSEDEAAHGIIRPQTLARRVERLKRRHRQGRISEATMRREVMALYCHDDDDSPAAQARRARLEAQRAERRRVDEEEDAASAAEKEDGQEAEEEDVEQEGEEVKDEKKTKNTEKEGEKDAVESEATGAEKKSMPTVVVTKRRVTRSVSQKIAQEKAGEEA